MPETDFEAIEKVTCDNLDKLATLLKGCRRFYIFIHDNPDPDCIASAQALKVLLKDKFQISSSILYGGIVGRAENVALLERCNIHIVHVDTVRLRNIRYCCLLDTQPNGGNNSFPDYLTPTFVIDHHPRKRATKAKLVDIRPLYGATCTILTEYLMAADVKITSILATSIIYAILSETEFLGRDTTDKDIKIYTSLLPIINHRKLSKIIHPPLRREYFVDLHRAIENTFYYKNVVGTYIMDASYPDIVAQVADLILKSKGRTWAICMGIYDGALYVSIRTTNIRGRCGVVMRRLIGKQGTAGGHEMIAGGKIPLDGKDEADIKNLIDGVIAEFIKILGHKGDPQTKRLLSV